MDPDREALLVMFQAEAEEGFAAMEESLLALESSPDAPEVLGGLFRAAHTLKGNAASLGFEGLAEFAHVLEDVLDRVRGGIVPVTHDLCTLLLECVDALRAILAATLDGSDGLGPDHRRLLERLAETAATGAADANSAPRGPAAGEGDTPGRPHSLAPVAVAGRRTLRVQVDRLDEMLNLVGELAVARGRLRGVLEDEIGRRAPDVYEDVDRLANQLQELVMRVRLVPLAPVFRQLDRTVRDVAAACGKSAKLVPAAEDVEADTSVVEPLRDALTHLVRNAVDHGIEMPDRRRALGKDPAGTVRLSAHHEGASLVVEVADDGAGLPRARLLAKARAQGLVREGERISEEEVDRLVFHPGLSTAEEVSAISGRGVGMDVVRHNVETLRGSVRVRSREDAGTTVTIRLPLTVAILQGFAVRVGEETYVIPMDSVLECDELRVADGIQTEGGGVVYLRGEAVPYLRLRHHFAVGGTPPARESVVIVRDDRLRAGLAVDALLGESQAVIKPLGGPLRGTPGLGGATVRGDGSVALILDVPALLREAVSRQVA
jgi:two-component system, chemotaxis family, sensor kinase CheA